MNVPPKGARVAFYLRCSTIDQEHSISSQRNVVQADAKEKGWVVAGEFADEGESGATISERPGLKRLLSAARTKRFEYVVVYDLSRITWGGPPEFWFLIYQFSACGVGLFCCARQLIANAKNALLFTVDAMQAREENVKRSKDATRGLHQSLFLRDQDPGRRPPFGYDHLCVEMGTGKELERIRHMRDGTKRIMTPNGSATIRVIPKGERYPKGASVRHVLVPGDPEDVAVLREIMELSGRYGLKRLADTLNRKGCLSPTGKKWSASSIYYILQNKAYLGARVTNQSRRGRYHTFDENGIKPYDKSIAGQLQSVKIPESEHRVQEGKHEALVSADTLAAVRAAMDRRQVNKEWNRKGINQVREYLLSAGFGVCGRCGARLNGTTSSARGYQYPKYYCSANRRHGPSTCAGYSISAKALDEFVLGVVRESVTTPDCLAALASGLETELTRQLEQQKPLSSDETGVIKAEQDRIEAAKRGLVEMVKGNPELAVLLKPDFEQLARDAEALKRKVRQAVPTLDKGKIKGLVEKGLAFYQEQVLGPLLTSTSRGITLVEGAEAKASKERADAEPKPREAGRPCTTELKELLRLLGVKLSYDPDRKEGDLEFDPFAQYATGKIEQPVRKGPGQLYL